MKFEVNSPHGIHRLIKNDTSRDLNKTQPGDVDFAVNVCLHYINDSCMRNARKNKFGVMSHN